MSLLSRKEVELLEKTSQLLGEVLETLDIMSDKKVMKEIEESRKEAKTGKTKPFRSLLEVGARGLAKGRARDRNQTEITLMPSFLDSSLSFWSLVTSVSFRVRANAKYEAS